MKMKKIFVAGHNGMVGSAIVRNLKQKNFEIITIAKSDLDLINQKEVENLFKSQKIDQVYISAAKVGGIHANNTYPADFIYQNMIIETNIIHASYLCNVTKLIFLGSSCIYPKLADQPIKEEALLSGDLEQTNQWYATAKIAGIKLCQAYRKQHGCDFISVMPTNLYGPHDNFDLDTSHVIPALIRKAHEAKSNEASTMTIWGSGKPFREFMHVDDCASGILFLLEHYSDYLHVNLGTGKDITIYDLALNIKQAVGFYGDIVCDLSKPDGTFRKCLDVSLLNNLGWQSKINFKDGLRETVNWFNKYVAEQS